ncbi:MAG: hypothetical protein ACREBU_12530, partial [Nitrososphaera sp.]
MSACSPPPPAALIRGPAGSLVPYYGSSYYAFVGRVVGSGKDGEGNLALVVKVVDPCTYRQSVGSKVSVGVGQGCGLPAPFGQPFEPSQYPVGTRVRVVARSLPWDVDGGISV